MSWDSYIAQLMEGGIAADAVIVGCQPGAESVWAAYQNGCLKNITPDEIRRLVGSDRQCFFATGSDIAGMRCTVLRDKLFDDSLALMDLRTKATEQEKETFNLVIYKSKTALIILRAAPNISGGPLSQKAFTIAEHLKKCNM